MSEQTPKCAICDKTQEELGSNKLALCTEIREENGQEIETKNWICGRCWLDEV